jgi:hypothetical protein
MAPIELVEVNVQRFCTVHQYNRRKFRRVLSLRRLGYALLLVGCCCGCSGANTTLAHPG